MQQLLREQALEPDLTTCAWLAVQLAVPQVAWLTGCSRAIDAEIFPAARAGGRAHRV